MFDQSKDTTASVLSFRRRADVSPVRSFVPPGIAIAPVEQQFRNRMQGSFIGDLATVSLYVPTKDHQSCWTTLPTVRQELSGQPVYGAVLADYLMSNQEQINPEWRGIFLSFWGTIFQDQDGALWVASMFYHGGHWHLCYSSLAGRFPAYRRALVLVN